MDFVAGNRIELLTRGAEYFPALVAAIDTARETIYVETYIFEDDASGRRVASALCAAAKRGVLVRLMVDGFGARDMPGALRNDLRAAGVQLLVYRPKISPLTLRRQRLRRMHRKMACVDNRICFVGGINIIDDDDTPGQIPPRHDYAVAIEGPLVTQVLAQMEKLWGIVAWASLRRRWRPPDHPSAPARGNQLAALVIRDNFRHRADIEQAYLKAIEAAREEIILANAYFLPGRRFRRALRSAATRGVRVHLILQGRVEYLLLHYASRAMYGSLLSAGVRIHEYHRGFLHAKVAVCDSHWATVGSSNIDPFSLLLAREANVVIEDREFGETLRASLTESMQKDSAPIPRSHWTSQTVWQKLPIWAAYSLVRLLMGVFRYGDLQ
jgi:cardiolipin synthase